MVEQKKPPDDPLANAMKEMMDRINSGKVQLKPVRVSHTPLVIKFTPDGQYAEGRHYPKNTHTSYNVKNTDSLLI